MGASAAGLRCAARLVRLNPSFRVTVVEKSDVYSYAACGLPYVLSGDIEDILMLRKSKDGMLRDSGYFSSVKGVEVLAGWNATRIDKQKKQLHIQQQTDLRTLDYDGLVLATGARAKRLPGLPVHPRVRTFHTYEDVRPLTEDLAHGRIKSVAVIGAGLVGLELTEAFTAMWGAEVTLLEAGSHPLPFSVDCEVGGLVGKVLADQGVACVFDCRVERLEAHDGGVRIGLPTGTIEVDAVIAALGVSANVDLAAEAGIRLGRSGAVAVDSDFRTSENDIWACGDCIEQVHALRKDPVCMPLGSLANRQGRTLANLLSGRKDRFPPIVGATAVKIFDWNLATVGINRQAAEQEGLQTRSAWVSMQDTADYWPEVKNIFIQMLYSPESERVLGVQAVGEGEVVKRIDVAAQLLANQAVLEDFAHIEHAYAPPYAPALEPLAVAAMAALNQQDGVEGLSPLCDLQAYDLLDVRHASEVESMPVGSQAPPLHVPQHEIKNRIAEIENAHSSNDRTKPWMVLCARGARSAEVARGLVGRGLEACYLGGGLIWRRLASKESGEDS